jgi:hypothetical protein
MRAAGPRTQGASLLKFDRPGKILSSDTWLPVCADWVQ